MNSEHFIVSSTNAAPNDPSPDRPGSFGRCSEKRDDDEHDMRMLQELAHMGMEMARAIQSRVMEQIEEGDEPSVGGDPGLVFSRVAKVVRQSIALKRKIAEDGQARDSKAASEAAARRADQAEQAKSAEQSRIANLKWRVKRIVGRMIEDMGDDDDYEDLLGDLREKLDEYEVDGELKSATREEIITRLSRDLGIFPVTDEADQNPDPDQDNEAANDDATPDPPDGDSFNLNRSNQPKRAARNLHDPP